MSIKTQVRALREIHSSISDNWGDSVGNAMKYAAIKVIWQGLDAEIDRIPEERKPQSAGYVLEKLSYFYSYMHCALMPSEGTARTPEGWWEAAGDQLYKIEGHLSDFERPSQ